MLDVAAFGTGAMAQIGAAKSTTPAQSQTAKLVGTTAKSKAETKSVDTSKSTADKSAGKNSK